MEQFRKVAMFCVGRAVFFGSFAVSIVMLSFAFDLVLLFRSGAILALIMSVILLWYAQTAQSREPRTTETWLLLEEARRPKNDHAKRAFRLVMKETYGYFSLRAVIVAVVFYTASLILQLSGLSIGIG